MFCSFVALNLLTLMWFEAGLGLGLFEQFGLSGRLWWLEVLFVALFALVVLRGCNFCWFLDPRVDKTLL